MQLTVQDADLKFLIWTSRRYCDGRRTGVPNQFNEIYERITKDYPSIKSEDLLHPDATLEFYPYAQSGNYDSDTHEGDARPDGNARCLICDKWMPDCVCDPEFKRQVKQIGYLNYSDKYKNRPGHITHVACPEILNTFKEKSIGCCCSGHKCKQDSTLPEIAPLKNFGSYIVKDENDITQYVVSERCAREMHEKIRELIRVVNTLTLKKNGA